MFFPLMLGWTDQQQQNGIDAVHVFLSHMKFNERIIRNCFIIPRGNIFYQELDHYLSFLQELCFVQSPPITLSTQSLLKVQQCLFKVYISLHLILHHQMSGSSVFSISHNMWYSIHKFLFFYCSIFLSQIITFKIGWLAWSCQRW